MWPDPGTKNSPKEIECGYSKQEIYHQSIAKPNVRGEKFVVATKAFLSDATKNIQGAGKVGEQQASSSEIRRIFLTAEKRFNHI